MTDVGYMSNQLCMLLSGVEKHGSVCNAELVNCSLYLLQNVPATRNAVLEYLSLVFEEAAAVQLKQDNRSQAGSQKCDSDGFIEQISDVLKKYIKHNPEVWTPILSQWSIDLLGQISTKLHHSSHQSPTLSDQLQQWMTCPPTNTLIQIASDCLAAMVASSPEVCVDALLEASVRYAPYFDWVVAHIGSCFPQTVIQRVLLIGLAEYYSYQNSQTRPGDPGKIPKLNSVVGILGHLGSHHTKELHQSLVTLFQDSLKPNRPQIYQNVVMYVLRMASMSSVILQAIASNVKHVLLPEVINKLSQDLSRVSRQDANVLMNLVVQLIRRCDDYGYALIEFLLNIATPAKVDKDAMDTDTTVVRVAKETCSVIINWLLLDLQRCVHRQGTESSIEIPLLRGLMPHSVQLTKQLVSSSGNRCLWLSRLLACIALYSRAHDAASILSSLMVSAFAHHQLDILLTLYQEISIKYPEVFQMMLTEVMGQLKVKAHTSEEKKHLMHNLIQLVEWEKQGDPRLLGFSVSQGIQGQLYALSKHLTEDCSSDVLKLLCSVGLPANISLDTITILRQQLQAAFLHALTLTDRNRKFEISSCCFKCFKMLCANSTIQISVLRHLLEAAISEEYCELFGGQPAEKIVTPASSLSLSSSLEHPSNVKLKDDLLEPLRPTGLHNGLIGRGIKSVSSCYQFTKDEIDDNKQLLVVALWICSTSITVPDGHHNKNIPSGSRSRSSSPNPSSHGSRSSTPNSQAPPGGHNSRPTSPNLSPSSGDSVRPTGKIPANVGRDLAVMFVELVTPDVIYNGMLWLEKDFMKVTVERDLMITKVFNRNPVLWMILELLIQSAGALCYCSAILRSLTATMINFWETSRHSSAADAREELAITNRLISLLRQSGMLAAPLCYIGEFLSYLTPYEVHLLLLSVWKYIQDNPPDPMIRRTVCDPCYSETLQRIFESNISTIGHLYSRIFMNRNQSN